MAVLADLGRVDESPDGFKIGILPLDHHWLIFFLYLLRLFSLLVLLILGRTLFFLVGLANLNNKAAIFH